MVFSSFHNQSISTLIAVQSQKIFQQLVLSPINLLLTLLATYLQKERQSIHLKNFFSKKSHLSNTFHLFQASIYKNKFQAIQLFSTAVFIYSYYMTEKRTTAMICPFVPSHIVPYERFIIHVDKCKYPGKIHYSKCRFNPYHVIHKDEIQQHQKNCTQRSKYKPIQDDQDDWWGVEQKSQKLETQVVKPTLDHSQEEQNKFQTYEKLDLKKSISVNNQSKKVEIQDFDFPDYGYQGI